MNNEQKDHDLHVSQHSSNEMLAAVFPCPFCGGEAEIKSKRFKSGVANIKFMNQFKWNSSQDEFKTIWFAGCFNSKCTVHPVTIYEFEKEKALERWNTRNSG